MPTKYRRPVMVTTEWPCFVLDGPPTHSFMTLSDGQIKLGQCLAGQRTGANNHAETGQRGGGGTEGGRGPERAREEEKREKRKKKTSVLERKTESKRRMREKRERKKETR